MPNEEKNQDRGAREFMYTFEDFNRVRKLLHRHAGISLSDAKQELVYSRLSRRLRVTGIKTFAAYIQFLESEPEVEWQAFINAMTTNLTSFFREAHHFPVLAEHMLQRRKKNRDTIALWCSAASTGEEPYSMAMTAVEIFGSSPPVEIIATDLDTRVLEIARIGIYKEEKIEKLDPERIKRFFLRGTGQQSGMVKVRQELRDLVTFQRLNLQDKKWDLQPPFDAIFCRNVMIYFDKTTQLSILKKFVPLLRPDGLLFAGHSESFYNADEYFTLRGKTVYELAPNALAKCDLD